MGFEINKFWTKKGFWRRRWIMSNHIHAVIASSNKSFKRFPAIWCLFNNTFISSLNVCKEMSSQYTNAASLDLLCSFQCYSICHVHYDCTLASISISNKFVLVITIEVIFANLSQGKTYRIRIRNMKHCGTIMKRVSQS